MVEEKERKTIRQKFEDLFQSTYEAKQYIVKCLLFMRITEPTDEIMDSIMKHWNDGGNLDNGC